MNAPPPGLVVRRLAVEDLDEIYRLYAAAERADTGRVAVEPADISGDWARPSFDLDADAVALVEGTGAAGWTSTPGRVVGAAEVFLGHRAEAAVEPELRARGIGTWLAAWTEDRAREVGSAHVAQVVPRGSDGERLLRQRGYRTDYEAWAFELPPHVSVPDSPLPQGFSLRTQVDTGAGDTSGDGRSVEEHTAYRLIEDAFGEWPGRRPKTLQDWAATATRRDGFEPWQLRFVLDPTGTAVGVCLTMLDGQGGAFVDQLAVRRDHRGRGLGRALLADAFARGRERGASAYELATDSRTGARGLYESIGMVVRETWLHLGLDLGGDAEAVTGPAPGR